ncbi:MAG: hypothetical protein ABI851_13045 [Saprospiraceae bacterium]
MKQIYFLLAAFVFNIISLRSQTPNDAFMMKKGEICIALPYQYSSWDHYWEGTLYRDNPNLGTVSTSIVAPMFALGLHNKINLIAGLPWIKTKASAGTLRGESGIQDLNIWLKGNLLDHHFNAKNRIEIMASLGAIIPVGNYYADYMPLGLGLGSKIFGSRLMINWFSEMGLFASLNAGYDVRSNVTGDRTNYYTDKQYETDEYEMPNQVNGGLTLGYFKNTTRFELQYNIMNTQGGVDIRRNDMPFLTSNMDQQQVGFMLQQRMPFHKNLGIILMASQTLNGRNVGKATSFGGGILYQFNLFNKTKTEN